MVIINSWHLPLVPSFYIIKFAIKSFTFSQKHIRYNVFSLAELGNGVGAELSSILEVDFFHASIKIIKAHNC